MSIELRETSEVTHEENLFYDVHCFSCPRVSEENGDYLPGPDEIVGFEKQATKEKAIEEAKKHERKYGIDHQIVIRPFDVGVIWEKLDI